MLYNIHKNDQYMNNIFIVDKSQEKIKKGALSIQNKANRYSQMIFFYSI
jgi:hypothetical protein